MYTITIFGILTIWNMHHMKDQKPNTQYAYVQNQDQIRC